MKLLLTNSNTAAMTMCVGARTLWLQRIMVAQAMNQRPAQADTNEPCV